jgi:hypothetical protein
MDAAHGLRAAKSESRLCSADGFSQEDLRLWRGVLGGNSGFGGSKSDFGVRSIAERLFRGGTATTERDGRLAGKIPLGAIGID